MNNNRKQIGLLGTISIGIGGMVGGGIFAVLGEAVSLAHGATPIAFFLAGIIALLTAYSYSVLSVTYPSEGGTVVFIEKAFGRGLIPKSLNMMLWLSYLVTLSLYAVAFGSYGLTFFESESGTWLYHGLICFAILIPVAINLLNSDIVSKSETFIVIIKLLLLGIIVITSVTYVKPAPFSAKLYGDYFSILSAGMIVFVAYEGFELIANAAAEVKEPQKTLPRAYYLSVASVLVLYVVISIITVGTLSESVINTSKDFALAEAARPALGHVGFQLVAIAALLATLSAINATLYGNARLGYLLAKEKELPTPLKKKIWTDSYLGIVIVGTLTLLLANTIDLTSISIIASAGFLLIFTTVNLAAVKLSKRTGGNKLIPFLGFLCSLAALVVLLVSTWHSSRQAVIIFFGFLLFSLFFEVSYGKYSLSKCD
ncbi:APC family permease [Vibrio mediterranei]|uniref:APC family permease n=1 Tax=Vibrio mediterranei TaxID=689 RepID=UPI001EFE1A89|nr:APC family permease [Vibrio mediterranei]MCG9627532.1 APC family permease [Vibrio mediterranei]